ncbi:DUF3325 family protein [Sphingobium sp.]|uniref:DUF3325 family protein n=1 Tax=Sphingobium sp. TaxID=1912891 RepID=UPI003B3B8CA4
MMVTVGLLYLALFALAARMQRHRPILLGGWQCRPFVAHLELAGWTMFGLSLISLLLWQDAGMALVAWVGLLPLLAGILLLGMTYRPMVARAGVPTAMICMLAGLVL